MREPAIAPAAASRLVMRWSSVVGADGRTVLEACWAPADQPAQAAHHAA